MRSTPYIASVGAGPVSLAIDVGGTFIKWSVVDQEGNLYPASRYPTPRGIDPAEAVADAVGEIAHLAARGFPELNITTIGMTIPGHVDPEAGIGVYSENLGWKNAPIRQMVEDRTQTHVILIHDVRAAGNAEVCLGAGIGYRDVAVVPVGTGICAALYSNSTPIHSRGFAGEIGHMRVTFEDIPCVCGGSGCMETISSAAAIVRRYAHLTKNEPVSGAEVVIKNATSGDPVAQKVWAEAINGLAVGCAALASTLAPEVIVLAGGLSEAGEDLFSPLAERLASMVTVVPIPHLVPSTFKSTAGLVGAALATR